MKPPSTCTSFLTAGNSITLVNTGRKMLSTAHTLILQEPQVHQLVNALAAVGRLVLGLLRSVHFVFRPAGSNIFDFGCNL